MILRIVIYAVASMVLCYIFREQVLYAGSAAEAYIEERNPEAVFVSPEGVQWISQDPKVKETELRRLHEELLKNAHGAEMATLEKVVVFEEPRDDKSGDYSYMLRRIRLFGGAHKSSVTDFAGTLSHEYGHHFTRHYLKEDQLHQKPNAEWLAARNLETAPVLWTWNKDATHKWRAVEIMAEDYVFLYGAVRLQEPSPANKRNVAAFSQNVRRAEAIGHENEDIPHPSRIKGLQDYWERKTGLPVRNQFKRETEQVWEWRAAPDPALIKLIKKKTKAKQVYSYVLSLPVEKNGRELSLRIAGVAEGTEQMLRVRTHPPAGYQETSGYASLLVYATDRKTGNVTGYPPLFFRLTKGGVLPVGPHDAVYRKLSKWHAENQEAASLP